MPRPLTTDRLVLRHYAAADAAPLARQISAHEVQQWLPSVPHPYGAADARDFIERAASDPWKLAITRGGALIGGIAISKEFGYWLGAGWWGRGYATEAGRALIGDWFATREDTLASGHLVGNDASRNVLIKLGFRDTQRGTVINNRTGGPVPLQRMSLCKPDWQAAA